MEQKKKKLLLNVKHFLLNNKFFLVHRCRNFFHYRFKKRPKTDTISKFVKKMLHRVLHEHFVEIQAET